PQRRGAARARRAPLRAHRRPRGHDRTAGALRRHRRAHPHPEVPTVNSGADGERGAGQEKEAGCCRLSESDGERGAGKGGAPGPALSVRPSAGHALPTGKSPIPELLSEGGSGSGSRLTVTLRSAGFVAVAPVWRTRERAVKSTDVVGC